MYICRFLTIRFPLNLAPKCRKWHLRDSIFQNIQVGMPPDSPRNLAPLALGFRAYALGNQSQKYLDPPLGQKLVLLSNSIVMIMNA